MKHLIVLAVVGSLGLALTGCTANEPVHAVTETQGDCAGIRVVADFTTLDETTIDRCVATDEPLTALTALTSAGVEIVGSKAAGDNWVCRVDGRPSAREQLRTDTQGPFTEDCAAYGSGWAFWALFIDTGAGWRTANEGVATQKVKPGERIAVVWQLTDDAANMDAWLQPSV